MTTDTLSPGHHTVAFFRPALLLGLFCFIATLFCLALTALDNKISPIWYASTIMAVVTFRNHGFQRVLLLAACLTGTLAANT
ncbi:MAG: hypothetical protein ABN478_08540, partial [Mixta sp.]